MSTQLQTSRRLTAKSNKQKTTSLFWIYTWVAASTIPILPYAAPLWTAALADTPYAYLIWIPVFAFTWAGWTLRRALSYNDDAELNGIMGLPLILLTGSLLVSGLYTWDYLFVGQSAGLLVWPFWAIGLAWLMFGVGVTKYLLRPLSYLWLTWPPLYSTIVNVTNPILEDWANRAVTALAHMVSWLHTGTSIGTYNVYYGLSHVTVYVTSVCSGADSLLAIVILFPIILVSFVGSFWKKTLSVAVAAILALIANVVRLGLIILSIHVFGPNFSLGILHPSLGIILFVLMVMFIVKFAHLLGMQNCRFQRSEFLRRPGNFRFSLSMLSFGALSALLFPLYQGAPGTVRTPITVRTDILSQLMPNIAGWNRVLIGNYDASSILGPGSKSTVMTYQTLQGDYAMAELWWTYQPISLEGYSESNCLLFHGSQILSSNTWQVRKGINTTSYTVLLPANTLGGKRSMYMDTVYTVSVKHNGKVAYVRSEVAAPVYINLPSNSSVINSVPGAIKDLLNPNYPDQQGIAPLTPTQSVFLHNYLTLVRQFTDGLMVNGRIINLPSQRPNPSSTNTSLS